MKKIQCPNCSYISNTVKYERKEEGEFDGFDLKPYDVSDATYVCIECDQPLPYTEVEEWIRQLKKEVKENE
jgi:hypothetical protein